MDIKLQEKYGKLKEYLASLGSVAVAFSGGVDSTFLLYAAREALKDEVIAVTLSRKGSGKRRRNTVRSWE